MNSVAPPADPWVSRWRFAPRVRDVVAVVVALFFALAWLHAVVVGPSSSSSEGPPALADGLGWLAGTGVGAAVSAAVVVANSVALWWRRSHPVLLCVVSLAVAFVLGFDGALYWALITLAVRRRDRLLVLTSGVAVVASVASSSRTTVDGLAVAITTGLIGVALCVFVGAFVGARRDLVTSLRERAERAEHEQVLRAEQARLAERTRIAREMHDVLAHRISLVALHAGGLEVRPDVGADQVEATAATIRETARTALEDLRRVLGVLRAPSTVSAASSAAELAPQPTLVDVRRLVESTREAGVSAEFRTDVPVHADVPAELGRTVYRIVQEALTNVHKHAPSAATVVTVSGEVGREMLVSVVNARPSGVSAGLPGAGSGLVGLSERVGLADGTLTSGPEPGGGFAVRARLPWAAPDGRPRAGSGAAWTPPDARIVRTPAGSGSSQDG
ncbi:sensor histidine kinase [Kineococcus rhizosphaerae]|uniref:histidine kinase n=1 Tax=Kineococcus rhizosphaerae TaxID=559628 RepID=A0A2T0R717_9ACTN|nr:histidine kinase [Kineococcus rhizosphaerae]PRY16943.1 signal transduction histidine kinase [Kineococcus rhizosphaerae]